jgi:hypothetical protein
VLGLDLPSLEQEINAPLGLQYSVVVLYTLRLLLPGEHFRELNTVAIETLDVLIFPARPAALASRHTSPHCCLHFHQPRQDMAQRRQSGGSCDMAEFSYATF